MRYKKELYSIPHIFERQPEILKWCSDSVGNFRINWKLGNGKIYFRFKRDYTHFLLRWA